MSRAISFGIARGRFCAAALLALAAGCATVKVAPRKPLALRPIDLPLKVFTFPSGLRVVVERDTRTPLAGIFVVVGSGSSSDPAGKEGLAHYVEHLTFQSRPFGGESVGDQLDAAGCVQRNATTRFDATTYHAIGPAAALPDLLRVEGARLAAPLANIPREAMAVELNVIRNEMRERNESGFVGDAMGRLQAALFPSGHPYARAVAGDKQAILELTGDDAKAFTKAHYRPDNMTMIVLGNVDLDNAEKLLEALPAALRGAAVRVPVPQRLAAVAAPAPQPPPRPMQAPTVEAVVSSPELWIGWSMPRAFDREGALLYTLAQAAGPRFSRVRRDDRNIRSVQMIPVAGREASMLIARVRLRSASSAEKTLHRLLEEAPKIANGLFDPSDLSRRERALADFAYARVRTAMLMSEISSLQDLVRRGMRRADVTHFTNDPAFLVYALRDLSELQLERYRAYAIPHLTADRGRAVVLKPRAAAPRDIDTAGDPEAGEPAEEEEAGEAPAEEPAAPPAEQPAKKLVAPPKALAGELVSSPVQMASYRMPNGMSVVLGRRTGLPLVAASVAFGIEPAMAKEAGPRALALATARPESRYNDPFAYGSAISRRTGIDRLTASIEGSSGNAEEMLAALAEYVRTQELRKIDTEGLRSRLLRAVQAQTRSSRRRAAAGFVEALLPDTPYARGLLTSDVELMTRDAAEAWLQRVVSPANATLVVVGDFDDARMRRWIDESFAEWKSNAPPPARSAPPTIATPKERVPAQVLLTARRGSQGEVRFGCRLPAVTSGPLALRHAMAARLLSGRIEQTLRRRLGATYGVHARAVEFRDGVAYLELHTRVENARLASALAELRAELDRMASAPVDDASLVWARWQKASSIALEQMTNRSMAISLLDRLGLGLPSDPAEVRKEIESVSAGDLQEDFQFCLGARPTLSIVGEGEVVKAAVKEGWR